MQQMNFMKVFFTEDTIMESVTTMKS